MSAKAYTGLLIMLYVLLCCSKNNDSTPPPEPPVPEVFHLNNITVDGQHASNGFKCKNVKTTPPIMLVFSAPVDMTTTATNIFIRDKNGATVPLTFNNPTPTDSNIVEVKVKNALQNISLYKLTVNTNLTSQKGTKLDAEANVNILTAIDSTDKFPRISDSALLDVVQKQTFKYFWDFAHPVSGMARERNTSGDVVTTGGTGFGVMATIAAANRSFVSRTDAVSQTQKIVSFLKTADSFHGAFPHWLNGATGKVQPFSDKDNGADLVETSFLMQGLLTARQYYNQSSTTETQLRKDIDSLWKAVDWSWFRKDVGSGPENVLYWHWSPNYNWDIGLRVSGWNEALMTYVLAASSPTHTVPKVVYDNGWAQNGNMRNGKTFLGYQLPLGPDWGGPLFFAHYSFLGINPNGLTDAYANYQTQTINHTLINNQYCISNAANYFGYSSQCWGLTASDDGRQGYLAHSPTNDNGTISPTAAVSSLPYAPNQSMAAIKFFYYTLGDKLWKDYGFVDAFNLEDAWFADSFLAIDQGPQVVMIENYRTGLLWNLFMSCPEIKTGMISLGFQSPRL
ncbi:glucoamylase family protein [Pinibacter soli]|uniref:Glucoamylase family protein n=1 Tax=Pinibacter soli TaxID=3044211 RepID=A0ABT6R852_9BACT|nr:glucoamylase family protein [Pinibacter soli]MDI3318747.1 glucoamylase family protein [Pinibacter soli]